MKKVIIGMGISAAGKTTVLKEFADEYGYNYIGTDDIRIEMSGHPIKYDKNSEVWEEARKRLKETLSKEEVVVFDATFTNPEKRKKFLEFARENGAEKIQGIFFNTPLKVAKERNSKRPHQVEESEIERRHGELKKYMPSIEDGLDSIFTLDEYHDLATAEIKSKEGSIKREFLK